VSKPIEDPPSLVDILAREHAERRALIEAECSHALAIAATSNHAIPVSADTEVVEELTRKCCERRAALDKEANRG
jgi:hypothetical protein